MIKEERKTEECEMENLVKQLKAMGFTEYEAKSYVSLVKQGTVTAYQVSKDSGIPRARIYDTLKTLEEKGIVLKEEKTDGALYSPLPVDVFLEKAQTTWQTNYQSMSQKLKQLETTVEKPDNQVLTIKEKETIISYCKTLIKKAKNRIIISMWDDMYEELREDLEEVSQKVQIQGITLHVHHPVKNIDLHRITSFTEAPTSAKWFILSVDAKEMIYGSSLHERKLAFYTDDPVHIYLLEDYVWHDVLVNRLVRRSNDDLEQWISTERRKFFMKE